MTKFQVLGQTHICNSICGAVRREPMEEDGARHVKNMKTPPVQREQGRKNATGGGARYGTESKGEADVRDPFVLSLKQ